MDFLCNWGISRLQTGSKTSNTAHDSVVSNVDDNSLAGSLNSICREESQVLSLKGVFMGELIVTGLGLRLSSQRRVVNLEKVKNNLIVV